MQRDDATTTGPATFGLEAKKYVLFGLADETYGLPLLDLQEVIAKFAVTVLPNLPDHFHGVIGLRGEVIPILNLRRRFGFADQDRDRRSRVIIVDMEPNPIGIQVDEVFRVISIRRDEIEEPPELASGQVLRFVTGVSEREDGKLVIHLNMQEVLSSVEKLQLAELADSIRDAYGQRDGSSGSDTTPDNVQAGNEDVAPSTESVDASESSHTESDSSSSDTATAEARRKPARRRAKRKHKGGQK